MSDRLTTAGVGNHPGIHEPGWRTIAISTYASQESVAGVSLVRRSARGLNVVTVRRHVVELDGQIFRATQFALRVVGQPRTLAGTDRGPTAQIRQGERGLTVTAVHRAKKGEQRSILSN